MERFYLRIGEIPANERSAIFHDGKFAGYEKGVSVYNIEKVNENDYRISYLDTDGYIKTYSVNSIFQLDYAMGLDNIYIVDGELVGYGSDGEALLKNVKIISTLYNRKED